MTIGAQAHHGASPPRRGPPRTRFCDQPTGWRTRAFGVAATLAICLAVVAGAFVTWSVLRPAPPVSRPLTVALLPLAAPPDPVRDVAPGPQQLEHRATPPVARPRPDPPVVVTDPTTPAPPPQPADPSPPADPAPPVQQTTAPPAIAAPPRERLSDTTHPNWEGELLAHLERFRRYPARARAARQHGTAYVTFRMNRSGAVLAARIVRGSGSVSLDQAALDTLYRAQPLPAIPAERPDVVELTIPVQFRLDLP